MDPHLDEKQTMAFMQFVRAAEDGYSGTFEEYVLDTGLDVSVAGLRPVTFDNTQARHPPPPRPLRHKQQPRLHGINPALCTLARLLELVCSGSRCRPWSPVLARPTCSGSGRPVATPATHAACCRIARSPVRGLTPTSRPLIRAAPP